MPPFYVAFVLGCCGVVGAIVGCCVAMAVLPASYDTVVNGILGGGLLAEFAGLYFLVKAAKDISEQDPQDEDAWRYK